MSKVSDLSLYRLANPLPEIVDEALYRNRPDVDVANQVLAALDKAGDHLWGSTGSGGNSELLANVAVAHASAEVMLARLMGIQVRGLRKIRRVNHPPVPPTIGGKGGAS